MRESSNSKEKCSMVFAALVQFIGKVSVDKCMAAVKCVFPNIQRKTVDRQAYYIGIGFIQTLVRGSIKYTPPKSRGITLPQPILNDEEKEIVLWYVFYSFSFVYIFCSQNVCYKTGFLYICVKNKYTSNLVLPQSKCCHHSVRVS